MGGFECTNENLRDFKLLDYDLRKQKACTVFNFYYGPGAKVSFSDFEILLQLLEYQIALNSARIAISSRELKIDVNSIVVRSFTQG